MRDVVLVQTWTEFQNEVMSRPFLPLSLLSIATHLHERYRVLLIDQRVDRDWRSKLEEALERYRTTDVFVLRYYEDDQSNLDFHSDDVFAYGEVILNLSLESNSVLSFLEHETGACVRAAIPARSLAVLFGAARYEWDHAILADDVSGRRTSITLRTLSDELRGTPDGQRVMALALAT